MSGPLRLVALGVDALPNRPVFEAASRWTYVHPSNGLAVYVDRRNAAHEIREGAFDVYLVTLDWRGIRVTERHGEMECAEDAYEVVKQHAQSYVPRLWSLLMEMEGAEEMRLTRLRSQLEDERAEAADEQANV